MQNMLIIFGAKYLVYTIAAIAAVAFLMMPNDKKKKATIFAAFVLPLSFILAKVLSFFFYNPRPFVSEKITPLILHAADNGFPSDHTLLSSALAAIVFSFNQKVGSLLWILSLLVGFSRVLAGVHHALDIAGSVMVVLLISFLTKKYLLLIAQR